MIPGIVASQALLLTEAASTWLLAGGIWTDAGFWDDSSFWED